MAQQHQENIWYKLIYCTNVWFFYFYVGGMFESWSPEIQGQLLAEWNDWQDEPKKSGYMCDQCDKVFSRIVQAVIVS